MVQYLMIEKIRSWSQVGIFLPAYIGQICEYVCPSNNVNKWISWSQTTLDLYVVVLSSTKLNYYCHSQIRLLWWLRFGFFAELSLSFSFSLTEQVIASANPNTQHPDKYKFLVLQLKHEMQSSLNWCYEL